MTDSYGNDGSFGGSPFKGKESLGNGVQRTDLDNPPSTNGEGVKALWRRKMKGCGSTYADFLDGRGIVRAHDETMQLEPSPPDVLHTRFPLFEFYSFVRTNSLCGIRCSDSIRQPHCS